ncbi:hypothetical protein DICVIV_08442 [Dictyocaulus viviparus]|uniref:Uncharacterized protein n=1 Tax=Dictyocaulus viviparus TaxID=29172 RepID=A0A0D8XLV6_DICVI|nr:hypothetical protein DICVIV_08442 [Dictyocaulus viviparus]
MADAKEEKEDQIGREQAEPNRNTANSLPILPVTELEISKASSTLIDESMRLLGLRPSSASLTLLSESRTSTNLPRSPAVGLSSNSSTTRFPIATPRFKQVDFDDRLANFGDDKKPAWKTWQESVKESYYKARRSVERSKDEKGFLESTLSPSKLSRAESSFEHLYTNSEFIPSVRSQCSLMTPSLYDRTLLVSSSSSGHVFAGGSGPYAAPAVSTSQGIESNYERRANNIEAILLKTAPLPQHMKTITTKEFRNAPAPSAGSASELDDYDFSRYCPKPYYSRPNRDDPDYFDFDLQHSVDLFKRPEGKYTPRGPQVWENKLLGEVGAKGSAPVSGYMFTKGDPDWRTNGTSYLSAALRTPKFWEQRFQSLARQVRDSNPLSLDSINRNRPVPNRFTEYTDPDFADYEDPRSCD